MAKKPILYNLNFSPPVRFVKILARLIELELEIRDVNFMGGEHLVEPFISINPEHTVPALDDNGAILWDSHAICPYLVDKYASDDSLYPKDLYLRAQCNQRLFFNNGVLFAHFKVMIKSVFAGADSISEEWIKSAHEGYAFLEVFLASSPFLVGDQLTVADIGTSINVSTFTLFEPLDEERHANVIAWLNRVKEEIPFFDEMNAEYATELYDLIMDTMEANKSAE